MVSFFLKKWREWIEDSFSMQEFFSHKKTNKRILCIDDEPSFCHFVQQVGRALHIQVTICFSYFEAKEKIEQLPSYDAFIVDGYLPDGSGIELIAWMRENKKISAPIAFVSRIYHDAASFRILKDVLSVHYVLEKPLQLHELHQLLLLLCNVESPRQKTIASNDVFSRLQMDYKKTIPKKIERIEHMVLAIQRDPSIEHLHRLYVEMHKMAGSAGSYGYHAVSAMCLEIQYELIQQIELAKKGQLNPVWLFSLEDFLTNIKLHFQIGLPFIGFDPSLHKPYPEVSVYIVQENQVDIKLLSTLPSQVVGEWESDLGKAMKKILSPDFFPNILLVNSDFPSSFLRGYDLLRAFYRKTETFATYAGIIVDSAEKEKQVEAFRKGISLICSLPSTLSPFFSLLARIPFPYLSPSPKRKIGHVLMKEWKKRGHVKESEDHLIEKREIFTQVLQYQIERASPEEIIVICLLQFGNFDVLPKNRRHELLDYMREEFENLLKKQEIISYLGHGEWTIAFRGLDPLFVRLFMHSFVLDLTRHITEVFGNIEVVINTSVVVVTNETATHSLHRAKKLLSQIQEPDTSFIFDPSYPFQKELFVFDTENQDIKKFAEKMKERGFSLFDKREEEVFFQKQHFPLLILSQDFLEKDSGLIENFFHFRHRMTFYTLNNDKWEEVLWEIFERIAYFDYPFGLVILITSSKDTNTKS